MQNDTCSNYRPMDILSQISGGKDTAYIHFNLTFQEGDKSSIYCTVFSITEPNEILECYVRRIWPSESELREVRISLRGHWERVSHRMGKTTHHCQQYPWRCLTALCQSIGKRAKPGTGVMVLGACFQSPDQTETIFDCLAPLCRAKEVRVNMISRLGNEARNRDDTATDTREQIRTSIVRRAKDMMVQQPELQPLLFLKLPWELQDMSLGHIVQDKATVPLTKEMIIARTQSLSSSRAPPSPYGRHESRKHRMNSSVNIHNRQKNGGSEASNMANLQSRSFTGSYYSTNCNYGIFLALKALRI